ncbi:MAG: glycosyltransferase family 4 protein [Firmicutes bacterium]|nr:glycosyltransferase family 4 protein [Bacillota bacterium]
MQTIAHVLRPVSGGMLRHWQTLAQASRDYGFRILAFSAKTNDFEQLRPYVDSVYPLPLFGGINPVQDGRSVYRLYRLLRRFPVDIVHLHGFKAALVGSLAAGKRSLPMVYTVHNFCPGGVKGWDKVYPIVERLIARRCQAVVCVSGHLAQYLAQIPGYPIHLLNIIYNGIDTHAYQVDPNRRRSLRQKLRKRYGWAPEDRVALTAARLIPAKGVETLLEAAERVWQAGERVRFIVAGDGPQKKDLLRQVELLNRTAGEEVARLAGQVADLLPLYASSDLFILPSWSEGLPLSLLEAGSVGLPVVATRVGGVPGVIRSGETGLLVEPRDAVALSQAILQVIRQPDLALALAEKLQKTVWERHSVSQMVESTYTLYRRLLDQGAKA